MSTISFTNCHEIDIFLGVACPGFDSVTEAAETRVLKGENRVSPFMPAMTVGAAPTGNISIALGIDGETTTICTGCSSGTNAIDHALRKIQSGASRLILTGGADAGVQPVVMASYANSKSLSRQNEAPEQACKPFDARRDGHVLSEAAGVLVLEDYEHARERGARIYAEVVGYGTSSDMYSMVRVCAQ